jgi:predicted secreted protein
MAASTEKIEFNEGELHNVVITIPETINLSDYEAVLQVRKSPNSAVVFEFKTEDDTMLVSEQNLLVSILPETSVGKVGAYHWQLKIVNGPEMVYKFPINNFVIKSVIVQ